MTEPGRSQAREGAGRGEAGDPKNGVQASNSPQTAKRKQQLGTGAMLCYRINLTLAPWVQRAWLFLLVQMVPPWPHCHALLTHNPPQRSLVIKGPLSPSAYGMVWGQRRERWLKAQDEEKSVQQLYFQIHRYALSFLSSLLTQTICPSGINCLLINNCLQSQNDVRRFSY